MSMNVIFLCKACIIFSSLFFQKNRLILVQFWFCRCLERAIIAGLSRVSYDNKFCKCHSFGHCCNSEPHWHHLTAILKFVRILVSNCFYVIKGESWCLIVADLLYCRQSLATRQNLLWIIVLWTIVSFCMDVRHWDILYGWYMYVTCCTKYYVWRTHSVGMSNYYDDLM